MPSQSTSASNRLILLSMLLLATILFLSCSDSTSPTPGTDGDTTELDGDLDFADGDFDADQESTESDEEDDFIVDGDVSESDEAESDEDVFIDGDQIEDGDTPIDGDFEIIDGDFDGKYHPDGWSAPSMHGASAIRDIASCQTCHGQSLAGDRCDSCHGSGWQNNCTFCHGGTDNSSGAPPEAVMGETAMSFHGVGLHTRHVQEGESHLGYDCAMCHNSEYGSFNDSGHMDQGTPSADVSFTGVSGDAATYDRANTSCSNLYCHSDGLGTSAAKNWLSPDAATCHSCHGDETTADSMPGLHAIHLKLDAFRCEACHAAVVDDTLSFIDKSLHINGMKDIQLILGDYNPDTRTCANTCHGGEREWSGNVHPDGWTSPDQHGFAFYQSENYCSTCHGTGLDGGLAGISCDSCHTGGTSSWRSQCTFCHGGTDNNTGAPPEGIHGEIQRSEAAVGAHSIHVTEADSHVGFSCNICHDAAYTSILSERHIWDGVSGAEIIFTGVSGTGAGYDAATASCSQIYCHGDGQTPSAQISWTDTTAMHCGSCHGDENSAGMMSGLHDYHLQLGGFSCEACHGQVIDSNGDFPNKALHINGAINVRLLSGTYDALAQTCANTCHAGERSWEGGVHPDTWPAKEEHGYAFYEDQAGCKSCHGTDLTGGSSGISCDSCHTGGTNDWRTSCTFCHGGIDNQTGAPPEGVRGELAITDRAVGAHSAHMEDTAIHSPFACALCHSVPDAFDDSGHIDTSAHAEVALAAQAGNQAAYQAADTTCSSVYCHGDGQTPAASVSWTETLPITCASCHGDAGEPGTLSGRHSLHLASQTCNACHAGVIAANGDWVDKSKHVDGAPDVAFADGGTWDGVNTNCTTTCHDGSTRSWEGGFHPDNWAAPENHGYALNHAQTDCQSCHGTNLDGGSSGVSCDSCHSGGSAWRTNCTFCHGGTDNASGAPPVDLDGNSSTAIATVGAHTEHVEGSIHPDYACTECHRMPVNVLSANHIFDATPGVAELVFTAGLSDAGTYAAGSCSSLYCHGNGRSNSGSVSFTSTISSCSACHPSSGLAGKHGKHLGDINADCYDCHGGVVDSNDNIDNRSLHVNGAVNILFPGGGTFSGGRCSLTCHGKTHNNWSW